MSYFLFMIRFIFCFSDIILKGLFQTFWLLVLYQLFARYKNSWCNLNITQTISKFIGKPQTRKEALVSKSDTGLRWLIETLNNPDYDGNIVTDTHTKGASTLESIVLQSQHKLFFSHSINWYTHLFMWYPNYCLKYLYLFRVN